MDYPATKMQDFSSDDEAMTLKVAGNFLGNFLKKSKGDNRSTYRCHDGDAF
jgi:hypothetical protein